jgi:putative ABC transport system ATP-binding protein
VILLADGQVAGEILDPEVDAVLAAVRDLGRA